MAMSVIEVSMMLAYETKAAVTAERARCAAVCRAQAFAGDGGIGRVVADHCAEAIERGPTGDVAPGAQTADERMAQAIAERDAAIAARDALAGAVREFGDAADALMLADAAYRGSNGDDHMAKVNARLDAGQRMGAARVRMEAALAAAGGGR